MAEAESAHGKLSKVDQEWNGTRFLMLIVGVLSVAFTIIYCISSWKTGNWGWEGTAHDWVRHTLETSQM